jgi:hypothetical protein
MQAATEASGAEIIRTLRRKLGTMTTMTLKVVTMERITTATSEC